MVTISGIVEEYIKRRTNLGWCACRNYLLTRSSRIELYLCFSCQRSEDCSKWCKLVTLKQTIHKCKCNLQQWTTLFPLQHIQVWLYLSEYTLWILYSNATVLTLGPLSNQPQFFMVCFFVLHCIQIWWLRTKLNFTAPTAWLMKTTETTFVWWHWIILLQEAVESGKQFRTHHQFDNTWFKYSTTKYNLQLTVSFCMWLYR